MEFAVFYSLVDWAFSWDCIIYALLGSCSSSTLYKYLTWFIYQAWSASIASFHCHCT